MLCSKILTIDIVSESAIQATSTESTEPSAAAPGLPAGESGALTRQPISWKAGLAWGAGAVACFHLAYASPRLCWSMLGYLFCLLQLARLPTKRQVFYFGLGVGLFGAAPQLTCFWVIFGPAALALWFVLAFWVALFVTITRLCLTRFRPRLLLLLVPLVWTGLEYFRSELYYLRFSWLNIGYSFSGSGFLHVLHATGMYGIGFLLTMVAVAFWLLRPKIAVALAACVLVGGIAGEVILDNMIRSGPGGSFQHKVEVAGIQMEFPSPDAVVPALDKLLTTYPQAQLLVLSEYTFDDVVPQKVLDWCREHSRYLVVGGKDPAPNSNFYDTAFVVGPDGQIVFRQVKSVPIQFFKDGLPAPEQRVWDSPWGKIGICVCYDLSYTRVTDQLVRMGAQAIVVPTMDVIDWGLHQHQLHARVAPIRAAEYGIPIFRVASSGISQLVNARGTVVARADMPGQQAIVYGYLHPEKPGQLPFDRWLAPACSMGTIVLLVALCVKSRRVGAKA
jgi:apolipoprotein N-acyltransferase